MECSDLSFLLFIRIWTHREFWACCIFILSQSLSICFVTTFFFFLLLFSSKLPIKGYGISLRGVWCPTFFISFPQFHIIEAKYQVSATERSKDSYSTQPPYWSDDRPWILGPWLSWASSLIGWMLQSRIDKPRSPEATTLRPLFRTPSPKKWCNIDT